jgi:hypothetical protein
MNSYCVKCRKQTPTNNPSQITTKNGRVAMSGLCGHCGTKKVMFIKKN